MVVSEMMKRLALLLLLVMVAACNPKPREAIYEIDFSQNVLPNFIEKIEGFSGKEDWGRWTDAGLGRGGVIYFKNPLPKEFALVLEGQSMPNPDHEESTVRVGDFEQLFYIRGVGGKATIHVKLDREEKKIELIPTNPKSPSELGINQDRRRLGVGVMKIKIEQYGQ